MTDLAHDREGPAGASLVLLHAGIADRRMWDPQWQPLTRTYDVLRIDLRGFGESSTAAAAFAHHEDVAVLLDELGVRRARLVGCSMGAGVAVEVALARPDLVSSLVLAAPGGCLIADWTPQLRAFSEAEHAALAAGDLDAAVAANLEWWVDGPGRGVGGAPAQVRGQVAAMQRRAFEVTADWDVDSGELDPPALTRLAEIEVPTLVLSGGHDVDAIGIAAETVVGRVPHARHLVWPDVAHLPSMERPADFLDLLLDG